MAGQQLSPFTRHPYLSSTAGHSQAPLYLRGGAGWLCREVGAPKSKAWQRLPTGSDMDSACGPAESQCYFSLHSHVCGGKVMHGYCSKVSPPQGWAHCTGRCCALALGAPSHPGHNLRSPGLRGYCIPMGWNKLFLTALRDGVIIQTTFLWASWCLSTSLKELARTKLVPQMQG